MIFFIETMMPGEAHLMVNSAMVTILSGKDHNNGVTYIGDQLQGERIKSLISDDIRYTARKISVQGDTRLYFIPFFIIYHLAILLFYMARSKAGKDMVFVSCIFPVTLLLLRKLKRLFFPKVQLVVAIHGELEFVKYGSKPVLKQLGKYVRKSIKVRAGSNIIFLVYGGLIKRNVLKEGWIESRSVMAIDHPYNYDWTPVYTKQADSWTLGTIGRASVSRNAHFIFELAQKVKEREVSSQLVFNIVGSFKSDMKPYINSWVTYSKDDSTWSMPDYENEVSQLDYILFFYGPDQYQFTASGSFFDCVRYGKPVLALKNSFIEYYFDRLGNIGHLFDSIDEMAGFVSALNGQHHEEYEQQCLNIYTARKVLSIEHIGADFWSQLPAFQS